MYRAFSAILLEAENDIILSPHQHILPALSQFSSDIEKRITPNQWIQPRNTM
jgi:hypothetical protein